MLSPSASPESADVSWRPAVSGDLARSATERAVAVGKRLLGRTGTEAGLEGSAGLAVLFGQLDLVFPGEGWDAHAHQALAAAVRSVERAARSAPGLFGELGGVAFAAWSLSRDGSRYGGLRAKLDAGLDAAAAEQSELLAESPANQPFERFDVISGLAGTSRHLLGNGLPRLEGLVAVCGSGPDGPNWFTPPEAIKAESAIGKASSDGVYNCGLAHGIPGPLAQLSVAYSKGYVVPGQADAIARVAEWLTAQRIDDQWGANWPACMAPGQSLQTPAQSAWCYGSPGVARALWLAGTALDDAKLQDLAVEAMAAVYRRPWSARQIGNSPGLCHGVAGLLQITVRFANDTGEPMFTEAADDLTERLLELYRPELGTGYYSLQRGVIAEHLGLLDGAAGAALALLAAGTPTEPAWDQLLLLS